MYLSEAILAFEHRKGWALWSEVIRYYPGTVDPSEVLIYHRSVMSDTLMDAFYTLRDIIPRLGPCPMNVLGYPNFEETPKPCDLLKRQWIPNRGWTNKEGPVPHYFSNMLNRNK